MPSSRTAGFFLLLVICVIAMQVRDLLSYSQWYTDEDQTLLWFAGQGLIHFQVHSPNVLGANYNTVFEALPGALLHLLGVTLRLASPLGVALMATLAWFLLAAAAYRRGQHISAALALALPVCLSLPYLLAYDQLKGVQTGDVLAAGAVAASIVMREPRRRLALMVVLAGVGFAWDNASVIATGPALMAGVGADFAALRKDLWRSLGTLCGAALVPIALIVFEHLWYAAHPGYVVSPAVDTSLHSSVLWRHLTHPGPLFSLYAPELLRISWIPLVWIAGLLVAALWASWMTRRIEPGIAAVCFVGVLVVVLSVADTATNFQPDIYLTGARFMFLMPMGTWVVAHHTVVALRESTWHGRARSSGLRRWHPTSAMTIVAITVLAVASTAVAQTNFRSQLRSLIAFGSGPNSGVQMQSAAQLLAECKPVTQLYRRYRAQILVSLDQPFAYGCAAQNGLSTLFPPFDRRPWLVKAAYSRPVARILLWGGINCQAPPLPRGVGACTPLASGAELLVTPPRPVASTLSQMGMTVYKPRT